MIKDWKSFFPLAAARAPQEQAIDFALKALYEDDKDCVVLELGLGVGKSAIAATLARYVEVNPFGQEEDDEYDNGSYILTSQKILQEQYVKDFSPPPCEMKNLVSSANFDCTGRPGAKCSDSMRVYSALGNRFPAGPREHCRKNCPYKKQKSEFLEGLIGVTNYAYFLSETMYAGQLKPRRLLVVDEAHNIEPNISKFVELKISQLLSEKVLNVKFSRERDPVKFMAWVNKKYEPALAKYLKKLVVDIEKTQDDKNILKLSERLETMDKHICKVHRLQKTWDPKNWILNREWTKDGSDSVTLKPVDISAWTHDMLLAFGQKRILLSATILDKDFYMKSLGLDPAKTAFLHIDSPFDSKNKPIFYIPVGKMSYNSIESVLPKVVDMVEELLDSHKDEKGIIHCVNFRIVEAIASKIKNGRLLVQSKETNREAILNAHKKAPGPTVIVSPSMTEGVDLKDDLSRFQIFCKVPFPSLADEVIKKKSEKDDRYYPYVTAQSIVQATGRSVRNETDWAVTYILDACVEDFLRRNKHLFPKSFRDSFQDIDGNIISF